MNTIIKNLQSFTKNSCALTFQNQYFATKMQASSTRKTKDSKGRRLGTKKLGGNEAFPMDILVRQRGFKWHPGENVYVGKDHTLHAKCEGIVKYTRDPWRQRKKIYVSVEPQELPARRKYKGTTPPPPYCYHPELFPELAKNNPEPSNLKVPTRQPLPPKYKAVGMKSDKNFSKEVQFPQEFIEREQVEILSQGQQYINYMNQIDSVYNPQELEQIEEAEAEIEVEEEMQQKQ